MHCPDKQGQFVEVVYLHWISEEDFIPPFRKSVTRNGFGQWISFHLTCWEVLNGDRLILDKLFDTEITYRNMPGSIEVSRATFRHVNRRLIILKDSRWALCVAEFLQELACPRHLRRGVMQRDELGLRG